VTIVARKRSTAPRLLALALAGVAVLLSACGGAPNAGKPATAPGTPDNPMVAKLSEESPSGGGNEAAASTAPGYKKLVERQTKKPRSQFTPCNLVTPAQASAILGGPIRAPLEAPQGPTCIYRTKTGTTFVTVAVQPLDLSRVKKQLRGQQRVAVSGRPAFCGVYGQPMLYAGLKDGRVLAIGARCKVAQRFAARAVEQLGG
jgi:hypothetical protein